MKTDIPFRTDVFSITSSVKEHLDDDAINKITGFVMSRMNEDGGFRGKSYSSDLYYTFFALAILASLGSSKPIPHVKSYIEKFDAGQLGFIDLYCMVWIPPLLKYISLPEKVRKLAMLTRRNKIFTGRASRKLIGLLEDYRSMNGGYSQNKKNSKHGTAYAAFLAYQAYDNLGLKIPDKKGILNSLEDLKSSDDGYGNQPGIDYGITTATAAAGILLLHLTGKFPRDVEKWLLAQQLSCGGFRASPQTPIADILSTASAVLALKHAGHHFESSQGIIDFVESHWDDSGGFFGSVLDQTCDCEYTFYALLTLGCLMEA